jgi:hypothetical protein
MKYETVELEINVAELRLGMHVIRLDRPWGETDFVLQGFVVQRQQDIDALQDQCQRVVIEGRVKPTEADPDLALEFVLMIGIYSPGSVVEMTNGEAGIVIAANPKNRRRPQVILVRDAQKRLPEKHRVIDMSLGPADAQGAEYVIATEVPDGTYGIVLQQFIDDGLVLGH